MYILTVFNISQKLKCINTGMHTGSGDKTSMKFVCQRKNCLTPYPNDNTEVIWCDIRGDIIYGHACTNAAETVYDVLILSRHCHHIRKVFATYM